MKNKTKKLITWMVYLNTLYLSLGNIALAQREYPCGSEEFLKPEFLTPEIYVALKLIPNKSAIGALTNLFQNLPSKISREEARFERNIDCENMYQVALRYNNEPARQLLKKFNLAPKGDEINAINSVEFYPFNYKSTFEYALMYSSDDIIKELEQEGGTVEFLANEPYDAIKSYRLYDHPFFFVAAYNNPQTIENYLKRKNVNVNQRTRSKDYDWTALMFAVAYNNVAAVQKLIQLGANPALETSIGPKDKKRKGDTLFQLAATYGQAEVVSYLMTLPVIKADLNNPASPNKKFAMAWAANNDHQEVMIKLFEAGFSYNDRPLNNDTHYPELRDAVEARKRTSTEYLIKALKRANPNFDINTVATDSGLGLHFLNLNPTQTCWEGTIDQYMVMLLNRYGVSLTAKSKKTGKTILESYLDICKKGDKHYSESVVKLLTPVK